MAYTFMTGFEVGTVPFPSWDILFGTNFNVDVVTSSGSKNPKSGTYMLRAQASGGWCRVDASGSEIYIGCWMNPGSGAYPYTSSGGGQGLGVVTADGYVVEVFAGDDNKLFAKVNGSQVASGNISLPDDWWHLQVRIKISDASGVIQARVDNVLDISYAGDTKPGSSSAIAYARLETTGTGFTALFDNFCVRTDDWTGMLEAHTMLPVSEDTIAWTPSTGTDNSALIDERPPVGTDYVEAEADALRDLYNTSANFDDQAGDRVIVAVVGWVRARKFAGNEKLHQVIKSNGDVNMPASHDLLTTWQYYTDLWENDPDTSLPWADDTAVNAADIGIESDIA
jgi:hypothetical protein